MEPNKGLFIETLFESRNQIKKPRLKGVESNHLNSGNRLHNDSMENPLLIHWKQLKINLKNFKSALITLILVCFHFELFPEFLSADNEAKESLC